MNILHHKSWHVRNKNNIERVRKDEENAKKEEEEKQRRAALADSEARTDLLRQKAQIKQRNSDTLYEESTHRELTTPGSQQTRHINFFEDLEQGKKTKKGNDEYEKEKKEEKEKQEKAIGLLTYLGQGSVESLGDNKPWYFSPPEKSCRNVDEKEKTVLQRESDTKTKHAQDPMRMMSTYMSTKCKVEGRTFKPFIPQRSSSSLQRKDKDVSSKKRKRSMSSSSSAENDSSSTSSSEEERKRHRKHKKKHKKKKKRSKKSKKHKKQKDRSKEKTEKVTQSVSASKSIQQLRAERLKREQAERLRTQKLLQQKDSTGQDKEAQGDPEKVETDERKRGYNSQFNPELARQRKKPRIDFSNFD